MQIATLTTLRVTTLSGRCVGGQVFTSNIMNASLIFIRIQACVSQQ